MIRFANRLGGARLLIAACVVLLVAACDFHYRAAADLAVDEVVVRAIPNAMSAYDHPARLSAQELASILQEVRVQFTSNWLQRLITGPLEAVPLFDEAALARVASPLAEALVHAGAHDRIVFYVAQRRANDRRDVTSGTLFVKGRSLTIALANHQNRVDVVPGLMAYDRQAPEVAVAPQRFSLVFDRNEFVIEPEPEAIDKLLDAAPPTLMVDYAQFLQHKSRSASAPRN
ncbi:MAG: hypothetical protein D4R81_07895 [Nitrospiraceae bacterium]|nr:MAG: hypothetical protein D4R81_07895 [Nitrospiraceae bacterium]